MIVRKSLSLKTIWYLTGHHLVWLSAWMLIVSGIYYLTHWKMMAMPMLTLSLIGTAVAFYVGFKNNQAYDRLWEGRKIWGAMVNNSRIFAAMIKNFSHPGGDNSQHDLLKREILKRHIGYIYQLRKQLLEPTSWEHVNLSHGFGAFNQRRKDKILKSYEQELKVISEHNYISAEDEAVIKEHANRATHLLDIQSKAVQELYRENVMHQVEVQRIINNFFEEQGKAERIKKFPLPRQYGGFSFVFVCIFVFLLPFSIVGELKKMGDDMIWLTVPIGTIIGWVYVVMELIGDYSENPFEGLYNDVPMLSICRTIEIDLLQMMGEKQVPGPISPKDDILI